MLRPATVYGRRWQTEVAAAPAEATGRRRLPPTDDDGCNDDDADADEDEGEEEEEGEEG